MGCGWTAKDTDYSRIAAIEVVNGGLAEGPLSGLGFWETQLNAGRRITAVGGSDNHDASLPAGKAPAIGVPTTVVRADRLSQEAILKAIVQGHVFLDLAGTRDRLLDVRASYGEAEARMGDALAAPAGARVLVEVHVMGVEGGTLALAGSSGAAPSDRALAGADTVKRFDFIADGRAAWLRVDVRDAKGALVLLGNPIYLNPPR